MPKEHDTKKKDHGYLSECVCGGEMTSACVERAGARAKGRVVRPTIRTDR